MEFNNQSVDPSQVTDPDVLRAMLAQQQTPAASQGSESDAHPLTDPIAQLAWALHNQANGSPTADQPAQTPDPQLVGVRPQIPINGPIGWLGKLITGHPISMGGDAILGTNQVPDQSGVPDALKIQPIGKDDKGNPIYDRAEVEKLRQTMGSAYMFGQKLSMKDPLLTTVDQVAPLIGGDTDKAKELLAANPGGLRQSMLSVVNSGTKAGASQQMADARTQQVATQIMGQVLQYGGPGAVQKSMQDASSRVNNLTRSGGIYDIIQNQQAGKADKRQRNLYQMEIGRAINPAGVLTNEALNGLATNSAGQKVSDWTEWFTNTATPTQYDGFMTGLKQLADNELNINQGLFKAGADMSLKIIGRNAPGAAAAGQGALAANPVLTTPPGQSPDTARNPLNPAQPNPNDHSAETTYLNKIGAVISPGNLKWARKKMQAKPNGR